MRESLKSLITKFIKNNKLTQTFNLFEMRDTDFVELEDTYLLPLNKRIRKIKTVTNSKGEVKNIEILQVGLDTEYQEQEFVKKNDIISYQLYFEAFNVGLILYNDKKTYERLCLGELIRLVNDVFNVGNPYREIEFISHFSAAEFNSFKNYRQFIRDNDMKDSIKLIQKSFVTTSPLHYKYNSNSNHPKSIDVTISDTWLMSGKESLKNITSGPEFPINKIELTQHQIKNMKQLLETDKQLFDRYSIIDSYLTLKYNNQFYETLKTEFGVDERVLTASSISAKVFQKRFGKECDELIGKEKYTYKKVDTRSGTAKIQYLTAEKFKSGIEHLRESYYGGRNETFCAGVSKDQIWEDYDLKSAYPTALLTMRDMNWDNKIGISNHKEDWEALEFNDLGIVTLKFKFKDNVEMPAFPIRDCTTGGLVFVREGETTIPIPELYMAYVNDMLDMKHTQIITGYKFEKKAQAKIAGLVAEFIITRNLKPKGTTSNTLCKLINNAFYGKLTQGVVDKNILDFFGSDVDNSGDFEFSDLDYNKQRQSPIYNPGMASFITGVIRAMVSEQMNYIESKKWAKVISVTTDGYMVNTKLTAEQIEELNQLPFTKQVEANRRAMIEEQGVLELKHYSSDKGQNIAVKTRCYWMNDEVAKETHNTSKILISRGGAQSQGSKEVDMEYMTTLLATANSETKIHISTMTDTLGLLAGEDLVKRGNARSFNMDYDFKRQPDLQTALDEDLVYLDENNEKQVTRRLTFKSNAWDTFKQYLNVKKNYQTYEGKGIINKIRTKEELSKFINYNEQRDLGIKVFKNNETNITKYVAKVFMLHNMIKNNITLKELDIKLMSEQLNMGNKQLHNITRAVCFKTKVINEDYIKKMEYTTYLKNKEDVDYLLENLNNEMREEFLNYLVKPKKVVEVVNITEGLNPEDYMPPNDEDVVEVAV